MMVRPSVLLDACVLANFSLCDTLLRLAEPPRLFDPKWTDSILLEVTRTLENKLGWPQELTRHFERELRAHFANAWIFDYEAHVNQMTNDPKDRHVVAAAVVGLVPLILTFNLKHFRPSDLEQLGILAMHPQLFLSELLRQEPQVVLQKLQIQAADRSRTLSQLVEILSTTVPEFARAVSHLTRG